MVQRRPPEPCTEPFTPCWCESRPNHPRCDNVDTVPINSMDYQLVATLLIIFILFFRLRK